MYYNLPLQIPIPPELPRTTWMRTQVLAGAFVFAKICRSSGETVVCVAFIAPLPRVPQSLSL